MIVQALPQYRVFVDPPIEAKDVPAGVSDIQVALCFRELKSTDVDLNYCPLGKITLPAPNGPDEPLQFLELREGADLIPQTYPLQITPKLVSHGFGLIISVDGVVNGSSMSFGSHLYQRVRGIPGETIRTGFLPYGEFGSYQASVGADCLPEFTGVECNVSITPATLTSMEVTTDSFTKISRTSATPSTQEQATVTMETPTSEEPAMTTETPADEDPAKMTTEAPTSEEPAIMTTETPADEDPATMTSGKSEEPALVSTETLTREKPATLTAEKTLTSEEPAIVTTETPTGEEIAETMDWSSTDKAMTGEPTTMTTDTPSTEEPTTPSTESKAKQPVESNNLRSNNNDTNTSTIEPKIVTSATSSTEESQTVTSETPSSEEPRTVTSEIPSSEPRMVTTEKPTTVKPPTTSAHNHKTKAFIRIVHKITISF